MNRLGTLIVTQEEIVSALTLREYIPIVEQAHALHAKGCVYEPDLLHAEVKAGEFHLKTGGLQDGQEEYYGVKINGGFFSNREHYGLPNILGVIYLCDARNGYPLAMMDSVIISRLRTGAATAVAAKYLATHEAAEVGIFGTGAQAEVQAKALAEVLDIKRIRIHGRNKGKAQLLASRLKKELGIAATACEAEDTARNSNILVTATAARAFYVREEWIQPGTFIAAVGADSPGKQELEPTLVARAHVVADVKRQACRVGELQHALSANLMQEEDVYAELGEIVTGKRPRPGKDEVVIYDSTGTALQDIGVAVAIYKKLKEKKRVKLF